MMRTTYVLGTLMLGAAVLGGCNGKDPENTSTTKTSHDSDSDSASGSETGVIGTGSSGSVSVGGTTSTTTTTDPVTTTAPTGTSCMFLGCGGTDTGGVAQCDIWNEDCPEGQKCMPWDNMGGADTWNSTTCSDINGMPGQKGDECTVEGSSTSGIDTCDKHLLCWYVNDMNVGTCIDMCSGSEEAPTCPDGAKCDVSNNGSLILCLMTCDPLVQSCPEGQICFFDGVDEFICDFDASGDEGQYGDACAYINVCDYGLFCADQASVPDCASGDGCCSPYCNLMEPNTCPGAPMQECVPWYTEGAAPPGQENIGACAIPV
jgi:hypothetical protein